MSVLSNHDVILELRRVIRLPQRKAAKCLRLMLKTMKAALESGDAVNLRGLGKLEIIYTPARRYRDRKAGKMRTKRATRTGVFQPWKEYL